MTLSSTSSDVYAGIITHAQDPQGLGRVRLRIPQVSGDAVTGWAYPSGQVARQAGAWCTGPPNPARSPGPRSPRAHWTA